jgi:DNA-binding GntR family transcriptional regulator
MKTFAEKTKKISFSPTVLVDSVAETLTEAILSGVFARGDKLIELDLRERFGISRTPIREAFRILEKQGLVEITPRKGTFVRKISKTDIKEHFPVRSTLEGLAAREAYGKMSDEEIRDMEKVLQKMRNAAARKDHLKYFESHTKFHDIFISASGNSLLIDNLKTLRMHMIWNRYSTNYFKENFKKSLQVHEKLLEYFREKRVKPEVVDKAVREHIEAALDSFLRYLDTNKNIE